MKKKVKKVVKKTSTCQECKFDLEKRNALLMRVINGFVKFTSGRVKWCPLCGEVDYAEPNAPRVLICKKCLSKKC